MQEACVRAIGRGRTALPAKGGVLAKAAADRKAGLRVRPGIWRLGPGPSGLVLGAGGEPACSEMRHRAAVRSARPALCGRL
jgi:hypothetical protein